MEPQKADRKVETCIPLVYEQAIYVNISKENKMEETTQQIEMYKCRHCKQEKEASLFVKDTDPKRKACKECKRAMFKKYYANNREREKNRKATYRSTEHGQKIELLAGARRRARQKNLPFNLTLEDIPDVPEYCPIFTSIKIGRGAKGGSKCSPSLDRIHPSLGYVAGNVQIISNRANTIKSDATIEEMEIMLEWMRKTGNFS
jgi:hypothetical protein